MSRGFTLLEVVVTIGLLTVLFVVGLQAQTVFERVLSGRGVRHVQSVLTMAQERARSGVGGTNWGVYFDYDNTTRIANRIVLYSGTTYVTRDLAKDVVYPLGDEMHFTQVSLSGASPSAGSDHEVNFGFLTGITSQYGSLSIETYGKTTNISLSSSGFAVIQ